MLLLLLYRSTAFASSPGAILAWHTVERVSTPLTPMCLKLQHAACRRAASAGANYTTAKRIPARTSMSWLERDVARGTRPV